MEMCVSVARNAVVTPAVDRARELYPVRPATATFSVECEADDESAHAGDRVLRLDEAHGQRPATSPDLAHENCAKLQALWRLTKRP